MHEDAELIQRIREGHLDSFERLYQKYKTQVFRTAVAITRDRGAAEEILQDCFVKAHANIWKLDGSASILPWLHRIAVNLSYNWSTRRRHCSFALEDVLDHMAKSSGVCPEQRLEDDELQRVVREAIDSLSFKHRAVVILYYLQGFSVAEIAYVLDCPVGTVKSRLHYACKRLRKHLEADRRLSLGVVYGFSS